MIVKPTIEELKTVLCSHEKIYKKSLIIPVYVEIKADLLTPVSAYLKLSKEQKYSFLFESVEGGLRLARYSFLGASPTEVLQLNGADPLIPAQNILSKYQYVALEGIPSFTGGAVGYVSFDCIKYFEPKTSTGDLKDVLGIPEAVFMFFDEIVIFDHLHHSIKIVSHFMSDSEISFDEQYTSLQEKLLRLQKILTSTEVSLPLNNSNVNSATTQWLSNVGQEGYEKFVKVLKERIEDGDIVQVVPSQRKSKSTFLHPFNIYRELRSVNPSPYLFYLNMDSFQIIGASPEMMCKVENRKLYTHPIAGTRRRGKTQAEDDRLEAELLSDVKETSEHIMLVDLGRNDVNRVCTPQSVKVDSLMHIEKYSHVMHIVSHVSGTLREDKSSWDAFRSVFPAGTVSGAPKIKAIELIRKCENEKRGIYAGAVGYFSYGDNFDFAIAIRTAVYKDGKVYVQAGGGIVYDSNPTDEYMETENKLGSLVNAIKKAEESFQFS